MNPGGSVKDRAALYVVKDAEEKGDLAGLFAIIVNKRRTDKTRWDNRRGHSRKHRNWIGTCMSIERI